ncbi:MAG: hypothetical protein IIU45_00395, partial [Lachnospiraceae bacterium]|nr:hypothetical protein [Lachnospiraceae bacterium]
AVQAGNNVESTVSCLAVQDGMQCKPEKMLKTLYTPRHAPENPRRAPQKAPQPRNDKILRLMTKYCEKYYNYCGDI